MEVIATGKVTTYPGKSTYQIVVETIEPAGVGALLAQLEERRRRLAAEGLFDDARKQLLPHLPNVIGVITSPTGAVIRDILHRVADRFPLRVIVWPVRVQGDTCAAEVARAIEGFNALPEGGKIPRPDVIIVARGGGSLEDLWGFNEEIVVRAAAGSMIPLVSAVGHETDWTLIDHAADRARAHAHGGGRNDRARALGNGGADRRFARRLAAAVMRLAERRRSDVRALARALPSAEDVLALPRQRLDRAGENLPRRVGAGLNDRKLKVGRLGALIARHSPNAELARRRAKLDGLATRLASVRDVTRKRGEDARLQLAARLRRAFIARRDAEKANCVRQRERVKSAGERMANALRACNERRSRDLSGLSKLMDTLSHKSVLARGFALVRDGGETGAPIRSAASIAPGQATDAAIFRRFGAGHGERRRRAAVRRVALRPSPEPRKAGQSFGAPLRPRSRRRSGIAFLGSVHDLALTALSNPRIALIFEI